MLSYISNNIRGTYFFYGKVGQTQIRQLSVPMTLLGRPGQSTKGLGGAQPEVIHLVWVALRLSKARPMKSLAACYLRSESFIDETDTRNPKASCRECSTIGKMRWSLPVHRTTNLQVNSSTARITSTDISQRRGYFSRRQSHGTGVLVSSVHKCLGGGKRLPKAEMIASLN